MGSMRTSAKRKAHELAKVLRSEQPDYAYLKRVFHYLRQELGVEVPQVARPLPDVPTEDEMQRYYEVVWNAQRLQDALIIKTLLYTGVRVHELINIRVIDVDLTACQIQIRAGKGHKDRVVPFPATFKEALGGHCHAMTELHATYLFESSWKRRYSERGIRSLLQRYADAAGLQRSMSPHKFRHFLLLWLKKQGVDDAFIQPYSGHASRQSLEIYSQLTIKEAQQQYNAVISHFPVK
jgi:integrase/recombinase XerD